MDVLFCAFIRINIFQNNSHCMKSVRIQSFSGPYSVRMQENTDHKNSEYGHFSHNVEAISSYTILCQCSISITAETTKILSDFLSFSWGLRGNNGVKFFKQPI